MGHKQSYLHFGNPSWGATINKASNLCEYKLKTNNLYLFIIIDLHSEDS